MVQIIENILKLKRDSLELTRRRRTAASVRQCKSIITPLCNFFREFNGWMKVRLGPV